MSGTISKKYLDSIRLYLRNPATSLDGEIKDLINAGRDDLVLAGVLPAKAADEDDSLIKRAVGTYVKAEFGLDNDEAERYKAAYDNLKTRLTISTEYTVEGES